MTALLSIRDLHVKVGDREVLRGINLDVPAGEVHAIMGPNGSGKSSLAHVLAGKPGYSITSGSVTYAGRDLFALPAEERAREGLFLGFQYPVEIPGVNNTYLLRAALNAARKHRGQPEIDAYDFLEVVRGKARQMHMDESFLSRGVNEGFSAARRSATRSCRCWCSSRAWPSSMSPIPASTSMRCASLPTASTACAIRRAPS